METEQRVRLIHQEVTDIRKAVAELKQQLDRVEDKLDALLSQQSSRRG